MKKLIKRVLILILVIVLIILTFTLFLYYIIYYAPMVPKNYVNQVKTSGDIEKKYLSMGEYNVSYYEEKTDIKAIKKYEIWYPDVLENENKKYPVVLIVNGTGVFASKAKPLFKHLASWGFIVIGNEDGSTWNGNTADKTLEFLLEANKNSNSIFYNKIDTDNIGITGHSQGGVGVFNTITINEHSNLYKCAVSLSPTEEETAKLLKMPYDSSNTAIPIMLIAGTEKDIISLEKMKIIYNKITTSKVMARKSNQEHGQMLYSADGYVTAWFMWYLQGDKNASKAFIGENPELLQNELYQDQKITINF